MMTTAFFGTDSETHYRDARGRWWLVQSPDMASMGASVLAAPSDGPGADGVAIPFKTLDEITIRLSDILDEAATYARSTAEGLARVHAWDSLTLLDSDDNEIKGEDRVECLREFRARDSISQVFFERVGDLHESDEQPDTHGPLDAAHVDWTGFPG